MSKKLALHVEDFAQCCHFCEFRHGGCSKNQDEALETYDTHVCDEFIPGKCYYCAIQQLGTQAEQDNICDDVFYPAGCSNFKEGEGFDYFKSLYKEIVGMEEYPRITDFSFNNTVEKEKHIKRRVGTKHYNRKLKRKADENKYIRGPWYDEDRKRVVINDRGKMSKWYKRQTNKAVRREKLDEENISNIKGGKYKKFFDYWWNLD